ncbi:MAG: hypothetical protein ACI837_002168, partial [Crocinitomicaceae bacterium]
MSITKLPNLVEYQAIFSFRYKTSLTQDYSWFCVRQKMKKS